ncbi:Microtubule protein alp7 [Neolecta irregularis DAH-3]|uniref:Microtubule protein alp7 n=1 Tax=Neolecta irregularis (strain DAH-3) TaxID=1198029 RepID=A0A1U7LRE9_NEOID|nr:Microtubule protein alp7 [Neolecta irregularis DAH-3]|eukprot:OLL25246.1 Microtubule protein alp7 [Neolecta irregularis DAH-3]
MPHSPPAAFAQALPHINILPNTQYTERDIRDIVDHYNHLRAEEKNQTINTLRDLHRRELQQTCQELHSAYAEKHARKVAALKLSYQQKYTAEIESLRKQLDSLQTENASLHTQLEREQCDKQDLVSISTDLITAMDECIKSQNPPRLLR